MKNIRVNEILKYEPIPNFVKIFTAKLRLEKNLDSYTYRQNEIIVVYPYTKERNFSVCPHQELPNH